MLTVSAKLQAMLGNVSVKNEKIAWLDVKLSQRQYTGYYAP